MPIQSLILCEQVEKKSDLHYSAFDIKTIIVADQEVVTLNVLLNCIPYGEGYETIKLRWVLASTGEDVPGFQFDSIVIRAVGGHLPIPLDYEVSLPIPEPAHYSLQALSEFATDPPSLPVVQQSLIIPVVRPESVNDQMTVDAGR